MHAQRKRAARGAASQGPCAFICTLVELVVSAVKKKGLVRRLVTLFFIVASALSLQRLATPYIPDVQESSHTPS